MRRRPVGTGPFKLAEFKMNEGIKLTKNPDYWQKGLPYLDGIACPGLLAQRGLCANRSRP
jgi:ABC-type oligopeptide transport system substrate-binding subunit